MTARLHVTESTRKLSAFCTSNRLRAELARSLTGCSQQVKSEVQLFSKGLGLSFALSFWLAFPCCCVWSETTMHSCCSAAPGRLPQISRSPYVTDRIILGALKFTMT